MSVLNVCTTDSNRREQQSRRQNVSSLYHRLSSSRATEDTFSTMSSTTRINGNNNSSSFETIFARLLDALIFTSAIAITAYSFLTGTLDQTLVVEAPPHPSPSQFPSQFPSHSPSSLPSTPLPTATRKLFIKRYSTTDDSEIIAKRDPVEDSRKRRTQEWADQLNSHNPVIISTAVDNKHIQHQREHQYEHQYEHQHEHQYEHQLPSKHHHHHHHHHEKRRSLSSSIENKKVQPLSRDNKMKRDKKRTQSLPTAATPQQKEEQEMVLSRMEEKLQSLILQGQEALSSSVKYNK